MAEHPAKELQWLLDMLIPAMDSTRSRRMFIEQEWLSNYRAWQGWPSQSYHIPLADGGIHYFVPHARQAVERNVKRATKLLMPNIDWHQTLPFDGKSHENAEAVHNVMRYLYTKKLPTKRNISAGLRCLQLYNFAILHTSVHIQNDEVWPSQNICDPFNFYIFPDTAATTDEALFLFEDSIIPYQVYRSFVNTEDESLSLYDPIKVEDLSKPLWPYHLVERLAYRGLTNPDDFSGFINASQRRTLTSEDVDNAKEKVKANLSGANASAFVALSKVYFRLASFWYYVVICTNIRSSGNSAYNARVVRLDNTENKPLYRWTCTRPLPGELYTNSPMDDRRVLQNLANNAISQVEANRAVFAEPPLAVDINAMGRMETTIFGNRRIWKFDGNPKEILQPLNLEDTSTNGIRAWQIYLGLIDKSSGGTLAEGQPGRNMPRSGDAANNLMNMALVDVEDEADTYEQEVLTPGLGDVYHIILEYIPDSQLIKIPNKNPNLIKAYRKNDITGNYSFTWLGALGFQDSQQRADKFSQFMATLFNPQILQTVLQQLQAQKMTIDFVNIIKLWYAYGLGERNLGDIIIPMSQEQIQMMSQPSPEEKQQQAEMEMQQQEHQAKMQEQQGTAQFNQQKFQMELAKLNAQLQAAGQQARIAGQAQQAKASTDLQGQQAKLQLDIQGKQIDNALKAQAPTRNGSK